MAAAVFPRADRGDENETNETRDSREEAHGDTIPQNVAFLDQKSKSKGDRDAVLLLGSVVVVGDHWTISYEVRTRSIFIPPQPPPEITVTTVPGGDIAP